MSRKGKTVVPHRNASYNQAIISPSSSRHHHHRGQKPQRTVSWCSTMADATSKSSSSSSRHVFYLVPTSPDVGLTSVSLGLVRALDQNGYKVGFYKPIRQPTETGKERSTHFLRAILGGSGNEEEYITPDPWPFQRAELLLNSGNEARLLQEIVEEFETVAYDKHVVIVEGLHATAERPELETLNRLIVKALDAEIIIVSKFKYYSSSSNNNDNNDDNDQFFMRNEFRDRLDHTANLYGGISDPSVLGCIINKVNEPTTSSNHPFQGGGGSGGGAPPPPASSTSTSTSLVMESSSSSSSSKSHSLDDIISKCNIFNDDFMLLGAIPYDPNMLSPRTCDMAQHLGARIIYEGEMKTRRVTTVKIIARSVRRMLNVLKAGTLVITPSDRDDIILAVGMSALNGVPLAGLLLTGGGQPDPNVLDICQTAFDTGLPLLLVDSDSYETANRASTYETKVPEDDFDRINHVMDQVAERICVSHCLARKLNVIRRPRMSPAAFMYQLVNEARSQSRRIVLPEGHDPRIIKAAAICHQRHIAECVLLGNPMEIRRLAAAQDIDFPDDIEILEPTIELRKKYVPAMVQLRKHKGLTEPSALAQLEDVSVLGTMMLAIGEVDGLVSGAVNSTANTVRPALQLIKTRPDANIISSIFFMCLPGQVLIYGDCAINPDPNAEQLADIALQSAASAEAFGIEPRVAMISYSTGSSGKGSDVDKVREATRIAQERRPDLLIDGPLQYDAASTAEVAKSKAPTSKVAGRATVLIFPDLNTGNTTYKAVQRTANVVAVGPMLQGLRRPVNDLSRGALVDDIVYTIALTAVQAGQAEELLQQEADDKRMSVVTEEVSRNAIEEAPTPPKQMLTVPSVTTNSATTTTTNPILSTLPAPKIMMEGGCPVRPRPISHRRARTTGFVAELTAPTCSCLSHSEHHPRKFLVSPRMSRRKSES